MGRLVVRGQRPSLHCGAGLPLGRIVSDHLGYHDRHVVWPAGAQRQLNKPLGGHLRRAVAQRDLDGLPRDWVTQTVGAQQHTVARLHLQCLQAWLNRPAGVRLEDQGFLRVGGHVFGREPAVVHERLHESVVNGDLAKLAVAKQVAPRIANVDEAELAAVEHQRGQRGAHAGLLRVLGHRGLDSRVGVLGRSTQQREHVRVLRVAVEVLEVLHHDLAGHLAGGVAAHAVRKHQQVRPRVGGILVVAPDKATVGHRNEIQRELHGISLTIVRPIFMSVPTVTRSG